ncbi:MAG: hypothetical protein IPK63_16500 [Candidatus Competibacteraceae bacterium]|nr:hypothetical protein [Candidatus Competibacteraceae bacterium]
MIAPDSVALRPAFATGYAIFDLIVFSYCLSMINPGLEPSGGSGIARPARGAACWRWWIFMTPLCVFQLWMKRNHGSGWMRISCPHLNGCCEAITQSVRRLRRLGAIQDRFNLNLG